MKHTIFDIITGLTTTEEVAEVETPSAVLEDIARQDRRNLLIGSDWTQVADAPADKAAWASYRASLRDITTQAGWPRDITWPTKPV
tara:strand:+ start:1651 stop:1908 length:258 start_codon:yes stop_codon:yes gene_type:complete